MMRPDDKPRFAALLTDAMAFYRQNVSTFALGVWWQACEGFEFEQVAKALTAHAMDPDRGQFAPKPADIVRQLQGTKTDRSLVAWSKVMEAIQRVGAYQSVAFDDPAIHCAIEDMGGWVKVARSSFDDLPHVQRRFCESHRIYSSREGLRYTPYLPGESEAANKAAGKRVAPPLLVGNTDVARRLISEAQGVLEPRIGVASAGSIMRAIK